MNALVKMKWFEHSGYLDYECLGCRESGSAFFSFETTTKAPLQFDYDRELAKIEADHAAHRGCKGRLELIMAKRSRFVEHEKVVRAPRPPRATWWRRLTCWALKHVPEDYTISACSPISTGRRCRRCGEKWPQCSSCGNAPATMVVRGSGEEWCRYCVGV